MICPKKWSLSVATATHYNMTEEDTFNRLRRVPFKDAIFIYFSFPVLGPATDAALREVGWSYQELRDENDRWHHKFMEEIQKTD